MLDFVRRARRKRALARGSFGLAPEERRHELLRHILPGQRGLEVGPYAFPIASRSDGFDCLVMDVFTTEELLQRAAHDPLIDDVARARIASVDIVGPASDLEALVAPHLGADKLAYIISSHNLEHIPDPIRFLRGCEAVLRPEGYLTMAIPDMRACMDFYRWPTTTADWLEAFQERRRKPTKSQVFTRDSLRAVVVGDCATFEITTPAAAIGVAGDPQVAWQNWRESSDGPYEDCHCSTFTPASFRLLILELQYLGLISLRISSISQTRGSEFIVHLQNQALAPMTSELFAAERLATLRQLQTEIGAKARGGRR